MKAKLVLLIINIFPIFLNAQELSIYDLISFLDNNSYTTVKNHLYANNWVYDTEDAFGESQTFVWKYGSQTYEDSFNDKIVVNTLWGIPEKIVFSTYNQDYFSQFNEQISRTTLSEVREDIKKEYEKKEYVNYYFSLALIKDLKDNNAPKYRVIVEVNNWFYDYYSKKEVTYHDNGKIKEEYFISENKRIGPYKSYYSNGKLDLVTHYRDSLLHGDYNQYIYDAHDNLMAKRKGSYNNGEKDGLWELIYLNEEHENVLEYNHYKNGVQSGEFQRIEGDSLVIGNYENDKLNGKYSIYVTNEKVSSKYFNTDIKDLFLITNGAYLNNRKTGEWNYYYPTLKDRNGKVYPFSKKLYLTENYKYDQLDGISIKHWEVKKQQRDCTKKEIYNNKSTSGCFDYNYDKILETSFYSNNQLHGPYELQDSNGNVITKGYYINGVKDGGWIFNTAEPNHGIFVETMGFYNRGYKEGKWKEIINITNKDPQIIYTHIGEFNDDKKQGVWERYNGDVLEETLLFKNNILDGESIVWGTGQMQKTVKSFEKGKLKSISVFENNTQAPQFIYSIIQEGYDEITYQKTINKEDGRVLQNYEMSITPGELELDETSIKLYGISNINPWNRSLGVRNGTYAHFDINDKLLVSGNYSQEKRQGRWIAYNYSQNVRVESIYNRGNKIKELYFSLTENQPFSGEFILVDKESNVREERRIKNGLRHGRTVYIDLSTNKTIRKEKYKKGVLK